MEAGTDRSTLTSGKKQSRFISSKGQWWKQELRHCWNYTLSVKIKLPRNLPKKAGDFGSLRDLVVAIRVKNSAQHGTPYVAQICFSVQSFWRQN